jgi:hypothetical protein
MLAYGLDHPAVVLLVSLLLQWLAAYAGDVIGRARSRKGVLNRRDYTTILATALSLLALLIGFTLSMATSRYEERKKLEVAEATAIRMEYLRASLLPNAAQVHDLLSRYTDERIQFYQTDHEGDLPGIAAETAKLESELWAAVSHAADSLPAPVAALVISGMNDVIDAQDSALGAWRNLIPQGARLLVLLVALAASFLLGYGEERGHKGTLIILPLILSASFFLITDVDSPRHGFIRLPPENLIDLVQSLKSQAQT